MGRVTHRGILYALEHPEEFTTEKIERKPNWLSALDDLPELKQMFCDYWKHVANIMRRLN